MAETKRKIDEITAGTCVKIVGISEVVFHDKCKNSALVAGTIYFIDTRHFSNNNIAVATSSNSVKYIRGFEVVATRPEVGKDDIAYFVVDSQRICFYDGQWYAIQSHFRTKAIHLDGCN